MDILLVSRLFWLFLALYSAKCIVNFTVAISVKNDDKILPLIISLIQNFWSGYVNLCTLLITAKFGYRPVQYCLECSNKLESLESSNEDRRVVATVYTKLCDSHALLGFGLENQSHFSLSYK